MFIFKIKNMVFLNKGKMLYLSLFLGLIIGFSSCNFNSTNSDLDPSVSEIASSKSGGTALNRSSPTIMIFPSDALLKQLTCLKEIENQGIISYHRDYQKAFIQDAELKFLITSLEELFSKAGYPLENLEQQLKQIANDNAMDAMDGLAKDSRTLLLNTARPDYIIELFYEYKQDPNSRNPKKILSYSVAALEVYTNKSVGAITKANITKDGENLQSLLKYEFNQNISSLQNQIKSHFADILANGIEITLRLTTEENIDFNFSDECLGDENYNDWVNTWLKNNTVNSSFKPVKNSNKELKYTNVRIMPKTSDNQRYSAFDFANDLRRDFKKGCGASATNRTQGIGDAYLIIKGLN